MVMDVYFGKKTQYTDFEYDLAIDLRLFEHKKQARAHQFQQYLKLEEKLNLREHSIWRELLEPFYQSEGSFHTSLHKQWQLSQKTVILWFSVLCRVFPKKRSLVFYGPSNTGKSLLARALTYPIAPAYIQRDGGTNVHWLENIYRKSLVVWEEPSIHMTNIDDCKLLLGGETIIINRKNKALIERPAGPSCLITTNKAFWEYEREPLLNRIVIHRFWNKINNEEHQYIKVEDIITYLCDVYDGRYE